MGEMPLVSVVITTKNEEKNIENCIKSILDQTYPKDKIEIIVVDNNSDDRTKEIARKFTDKVFDKWPERSAQRNLGVEKSEGEHFLYLDADMSLDKNVIIECVESIKNNSEIIALYIPEIIMGKKFFSRVRKFERSFYDGTVVDCARFINKDSFLKVGEFDGGMTGPEDWDLDKKLRNIGKIGLVKATLYHNETEFELKKYLNKKGYYAKSFDKYIQKWGRNDPDIKKQFGLWYRYFGVFLEDGKWKKLVAHPILTSGMYFLRFLVGVNYLIGKG